MSDFDSGAALRILSKLHGSMERLSFRAVEVQVEGFVIAARMGAQLILAQAALRGEYEHWLEANYRRLGFGVRQARKYKVVARAAEASGGVESALADLHTLRLMQAALGFKLTDLPEGASGDAPESAPRFEQFRIPLDAADVSDPPLFLEKAQLMLGRLQQFCADLSARVAAEAVAPLEIA